MHAVEPSPPCGAEALEWLLLTTLPVGSADEARRVLDLHALRWRIEDWHRILKSGCEIEKSGFRTAERMKAAVTINAVIAWRLAALTLMGRDTPELPAHRMFSASKVAMLLDVAIAGGFPVPGRERPEDSVDLEAVSLGPALLLVARLGGYLNRKNDGPPGHQTDGRATRGSSPAHRPSSGSRKTARRAPCVPISPQTPETVSQMPGINPQAAIV